MQKENIIKKLAPYNPSSHKPSNLHLIAIQRAFELTHLNIKTSFYSWFNKSNLKNLNYIFNTFKSQTLNLFENSNKLDYIKVTWTFMTHTRHTDFYIRINNKQNINKKTNSINKIYFISSFDKKEVQQIESLLIYFNK